MIAGTRESELPAPGTRVKPDHAALMPRIDFPGYHWSLITTDPKSSFYRFVGIEFTSSVNVNSLIIYLSSETSNPDDYPQHITFDRVYIHGDAHSNIRRAIASNGKYMAVVDSYISEIHQEGFDSQAIGCWDCPGPIKIVNNYLEAGSENVCFG